MMTFKRCVICSHQFFCDTGEEWKTQCLSCYLAKKRKERAGAKPETNYGNTNEGKLPADILHKLIILCHPDKHKNSELSNSMTAWLLEQKHKNGRSSKRN